MNGGGGPSNHPPPSPQPPPIHNDGDYLLHLLQNHQQQQQQQQQLPYLPHNISTIPSPTLSLDPAVAAVGPTMPIPTDHHQPHQHHQHHHHHHNHQQHDPHRFSPQSQNPNFLLQGFHRSSPNSNHTASLFTAPHQHFDHFRQQQQQQQQHQQQPQSRHEQQGFFGNSLFPSSSSSNPVEDETLRLKNLGLEDGFLKERQLVRGLGFRNVNEFDRNRRIDPRANAGHGLHEQMWSGPPPGFSSKPGNQRRDFDHLSNVGGERSDLYSELKRNPGNQRREFDHWSNVGGERSELYSELKRNTGNQRWEFDHLSNVGGERSELYSKLKRNTGNQRREFDHSSNVGGERSDLYGEKRGNHGVFGSNSKSNEKDRKFISNGSANALVGQLDHPGVPTGISLHSVSPSDVELSLLNSDAGVADNGGHFDEVDDLSEQLVDSVLGEDQPDEKNVTSAKKKHHRDKDFRSDARGKWILSQRMRNNRRMIECRRDIDRLDAPFLAIYDSLIPAEEEKAKQKQLMTLLEKLVLKEWPDAKLYLYGSCANSFGVSKSDIDVCLAVDDQDVNKSEMLLRLADILQSDSLQDVQALTRARVPIVKLMDPVTGISCDICVNNVLAVVNTKLLRDYADIDPRLRQLAFLVKHWAKSRGVNETYQGTLSSYAYVLMCIHFLQQRNPPILPCLQSMEPTYAVTVDDIRCNFFDQVKKLRDFGARNKENISKLLWGFFNYWAYCHDYANHVISVRTGFILRKEEKDWTRRIGNDRHLICIEDPFETSHDLGRVVDKRSIRVLREEFERAAEIMQYDPNPCVALFEPYIPS